MLFSFFFLLQLCKDQLRYAENYPEILVERSEDYEQGKTGTKSVTEQVCTLLQCSIIWGFKKNYVY